MSRVPCPLGKTCDPWGKGAEGRLVQHYDIAFVSTGDVLRKEIIAKSEVGRKAEAVVASGGESSPLPTLLI